MNGARDRNPGSAGATHLSKFLNRPAPAVGRGVSPCYVAAGRKRRPSITDEGETMRHLRAAALAAVAVSLPVAGVAGLGGVASAKASKSHPVPTAGSSVVCTKLKFKEKTKKGTTTSSASESKCYTATAALSGTFASLNQNPAVTLLSGGTSTWKSSGGTVTTSALSAVAGAGTCPAGDTEVALSGSVTATSGVGNPVNVGDTVSVDVCVNGSHVSIAPGTDLEF